MKTKRTAKRRESVPPALLALRRAAKNALALGRLTGTPVFVLDNGRIIDLTKSTNKLAKKNRK